MVGSRGWVIAQESFVQCCVQQPAHGCRPCDAREACGALAVAFVCCLLHGGF